MENLSIKNVISKFNVPIEMYNIGNSFFSNYINLKDSDNSFIYFYGHSNGFSASAFYQSDKLSFNVYSMENIYKINKRIY